MPDRACIPATRDEYAPLALEPERPPDTLEPVLMTWFFNSPTVHAFQGRTVDIAIAAMEANHPHLTTQKSFYVEISRARDRAELVTDDRAALMERLEAATGERIAAMAAVEPDKVKALGTEPDSARDKVPSGDRTPQREPMGSPEMEPVRTPMGIDRGLGL